MHQMMNFSIVFFFLFVLAAVAIPVLIGVFVYKDAKKRNMNAAMWTLVVVLVPSFIGLILYVIVRGDHPSAKCSFCGYPVQENYVRCPQCGSALKNLCSSCGFPLESDWKVCPGCGTPVSPSQHSSGIIRENDNGIWKLLIFVILIPLILCLMLIAVFAFIAFPW